MAKKMNEPDDENKSSAGAKFADRYPNIADWVMDGWIEMGYDGGNRSFIRALDAGGMVWEGNSEYDTVDEALEALEAGITAWLDENGI